MKKIIIIIFTLLFIFNSIYIFSNPNEYFSAVKKGDYKKVKSLLSKSKRLVSARENTKTGLMTACKEGHTKVAEILIEYILYNDWEMLDVQNKNKNTAMHFAVFNRHNDILTLLLKSGASFRVKGYDGQTPLVLAADINNLEAVKILIKSGALISAKDDASMTALKYAEKNKNKKMISFIKSQIESEKTTKKYREQFFTALYSSNYNEIKKYLDMGFNVDAEGADDNGMPTGTGLMTASENGDEKMIEIFIKYGADINYGFNPGKSGWHFWTALYKAMENNHIQSANILLDNGAEESIPYIVYQMFWNYNDDKENNLEKIKLMAKYDKNIGNHKIPLYYGQSFNTLLTMAVNNKLYNVVMVFINSGADANILNGDGSSPLMHAVRNNDLNIIKLLIKQGADPNHILNDEAAINSFDSELSNFKYEDTPLKIAIRNGKNEIIEYLKSKGAK